MWDPLYLGAGFYWAFVAVELPGVDHVVPYAVEASGQWGDGGEEGVAEPDGKDGVFLSERLAGCDSVVVHATYFSSEPELKNTACQRYGYKP